MERRKESRAKLLPIIFAIAAFIIASIMLIACGNDDGGKDGGKGDGAGEHTEHSFVNYVYNNDATCADDGTETAQCEHCDKTDTRVKDGTATGKHDYEYYVCKVCGEIDPKAPATEGLVYTAILDNDVIKGYSVSGHSNIGEEDDKVVSAAHVIIPATHNDKPVLKIDRQAFNGCSNLVSIIIPNSVTNVGDGLFIACGKLAKITVQKGNDKYHSSGNCIIETESKTVVVGCISSIIPADGSVERLGDYAFAGIIDLTDITIPNTITAIGESAFEECHNLAGIDIPNSVVSIGDWAFYRTSLKTIKIGKGVTSIGKNAFWKSIGIKSITVDGGNSAYHSSGNCLIKTSDKQLILGCNTSVIPTDGSVTAIADNAFWGCDDLSSVTLSSYVTSIGNQAFLSCGLTSVSLTNSVTNIGEMAFYYCDKLTEIKFSGTKEQWLAIPKGENWDENTGDYTVTCSDGTLNKGDDGKKDPELPATQGLEYKEIVVDGQVIGYSVSVGTAKNEKNIVIPASHEGKPVLLIADQGFADCRELESVTIPDSVTRIGWYAFAASGLKSVDIPDSVFTIEESAFEECIYLTEIDIPDSVIYIEDYAFYRCSGLKTVSIGASVDSIGGKAFWKSANITSISVKSENTIYRSEGNCLIHVYTKTLVLGCNTSVLPTDGSVTAIADCAFWGCDDLSSVTLSSYVTSIGNQAFSSCGLTSVSLTNSVTDIGEMAFYYCDKLTEIKFSGTKEQWLAIPKGENWDEGTGDYTVTCTNGTLAKGEDGTPDLPATEGLQYDPIYDDEDTELIIGYSVSEGSAGDVQNIVIPATHHDKPVLQIAEFAFSECSNIKSVFIPDSVKLIGAGAFSECSGLTNITIGNGVVTIAEMAFAYCPALTAITIPSSVESIGMGAFYECGGVTSMAVQSGNGRYHSSENCIIQTDSKTLILGCRNSVIPADNSVTVIGAYAFRGCVGLNRIEIPDSVTVIGEGAFAFCADLISVIIPASVILLGDSSFSHCVGLTTIEIKSKTVVLSNRVFYDCGSLTSIEFAGTKEGWQAMPKGEDWNVGTGEYTVTCTNGTLSKDDD